MIKTVEDVVEVCAEDLVEEEVEPVDPDLVALVVAIVVVAIEADLVARGPFPTNEEDEVLLVAVVAHRVVVEVLVAVADQVVAVVEVVSAVVDKALVDLDLAEWL